MGTKKYDLHLKGYVGGWDFDSDYVDYVLGRKAGEEVNVLIDSLGGSVSTALSISSAFGLHGNVRVHYVGMNASAATIASLGAKHVSIDGSAMYLVHKCSNFVFKYGQLNSDELAALISECEAQKRDLEKIDLNIASAYAVRCKKPESDLLELMKQGGWLSAKEAFEWGFVDEITNNAEDAAPKIDAATVTAMSTAGIPLPKIDEETKELGIWARVLSGLASMFAMNERKQKTDTTMSKTFKFICAVLQVEALAIAEGMLELSEDEVQAVENRLAELEQQLAAKAAELEAKELQIANLQALPAAKTQAVVGDGKASESFAEGYVNSLNEARKMFNSIP